MIIEASDLQLISQFIDGLDQLCMDTGVYIASYDSKAIQLYQDGECVGTLQTVDGTSRYGLAQE